MAGASQVELVELLSGLYPTEPDVASILHRAGITSQMVGLQNDPSKAWLRILGEVEKRGKMTRLVYRASVDFPERREEFKRAEWNWYQRGRKGGAAPADLASAINSPPGLAPSHYQDRYVETRIVGSFVKDE